MCSSCSFPQISFSYLPWCCNILERWFASRFRAEDNCQVYLRRETRDNEGGGGKVSGTLCQQYFFHLLPSWIVILYDLRNSILRISLEWEVSEWSQSLQMTTGCTPKIIADVEHDARYLKNLSKQCFLPKVSQCNILHQRVFNCLDRKFLSESIRLTLRFK